MAARAVTLNENQCRRLEGMEITVLTAYRRPRIPPFLAGGGPADVLLADSVLVRVGIRQLLLPAENFGLRPKVFRLRLVSLFHPNA